MIHKNNKTMKVLFGHSTENQNEARDAIEKLKMVKEQTRSCFPHNRSEASQHGRISIVMNDVGCSFPGENIKVERFRA